MDPKALRHVVAANIRRLAEERSLPLSRLADFSGIAQAALWRALAGESAFTTDRLAKIAETLDVTVADLVREPDQQESVSVAAEPRKSYKPR